MSTPPPTAAPAPLPQGPGSPGAPGSPGSPGPSGGNPTGRLVAILAIVLGGLLIAGTVATALVTTLASSARQDQRETAGTAGVTELRVDVAATDLSIEFGDVAEAELEVRGTARNWELERSGSTLRVGIGWRMFDWWLIGARGDTAVLTLPYQLQEAPLDASLNLDAGRLAIDGALGAVDVGLGAGKVEVAGSARSLNLDIGAGRAEVDLAGVETAEFGISAGAAEIRLSGEPPRTVGLSVSAGSLALTLPDAEYAVDSEVSAGSFDNRLRTSSTSDNRVVAEVSAGSARVDSE